MLSKSLTERLLYLQTVKAIQLFIKYYVQPLKTAEVVQYGK